MITTIWKTPLDPEVRTNEFDLPLGAEFLTLQVQHGVPTLWWRVCPDEKRVKTRVTIVGTGHVFDSLDLGRYLGTWQEGPFVWHAFERVS